MALLQGETFAVADAYRYNTRVSRAFLIGVTGNLGCGKSAVVSMLRRHGVAALEADAVVHQLLESDQQVVEAVVRRFGDDVRGEQGVNRQRLASIVFADRAALADLESIVHPAVKRRVREWLASLDSSVAVVEAVKLVEASMKDELDSLWLVTCRADVQRQRLEARGSDSALQARLDSQPALDSKLALADVVIDNSGSLEATAQQVDAAWRTLCEQVWAVGGAAARTRRERTSC
jgi:dephospho-CoA kinase